MTDKINWNLYSWVIRGSQRRKIIKAMNKPKIPTEIKKETEISITHVSKVLKLFVERGIAKCLTPDMTAGKLYALTERGERIRKQIIEQKS